MAGIFICYRREDSIAYAGRLYDHLAGHFGEKQVFIDIDTLKPGEDFVEVLERTVGSCDVLIAIIGKSWLMAKDENGELRLQNPEDFVCLEIAAALKRNILVIPALVAGAGMPLSANLPASLKELARRQAINLPDIGFHQTVSSLIERIEAVVVDKRRTPMSAKRKPALRDTTQKNMKAPSEFVKSDLAAAPVRAKVAALKSISSEGVYVDPETTLMWSITDNGKDISWQEANEYAKQLRLGGYSDWRLASLDELERLCRPLGRNRYSIREPFHLTNDRVWSSIKEGSLAHGFHFLSGSRFQISVTESHGHRALVVRTCIE